MYMIAYVWFYTSSVYYCITLHVSVYMYMHATKHNYCIFTCIHLTSLHSNHLCTTSLSPSFLHHLISTDEENNNGNAVYASANLSSFVDAHALTQVRILWYMCMLCMHTFKCLLLIVL